MTTEKNKKPRRRKKHIEKERDDCRVLVQVLFDNVSSGIAVYEAVNDGEDFIFVDFNRAAEEIEKVEKEKIIGKIVTEVFPGVTEFGLLDVFRRVYKSGTPEHHPVSIYKDQRIAGWRENYVFRLPSGNIIAIYDDITAIKRTEMVTRMTDQCFRAIADYTYDWELWIGPSRRILWTNPAATRVTGYTVKEILSLKEYPASIVYEKDRDRITRAFRSAVHGSTGNDVEFRIERKDGKVIWVAMSWQPIYDTHGHTLGHRESIRDITERKETQLELEKALQKRL